MHIRSALETPLSLLAEGDRTSSASRAGQTNYGIRQMQEGEESEARIEGRPNNGSGEARQAKKPNAVTPSMIESKEFLERWAQTLCYRRALIYLSYAGGMELARIRTQSLTLLSIGDRT